MGDIVVGVYCRPPDWEIDESFYRQLKSALSSHTLIIMGDFSRPDICQKGNTAQTVQKVPAVH